MIIIEKTLDTVGYLLPVDIHIDRNKRENAQLPNPIVNYPRDLDWEYDALN